MIANVRAAVGLGRLLLALLVIAFFVLCECLQPGVIEAAKAALRTAFPFLF